MSSARVREARSSYEEAAHLLALMGEHPPTPEARPPLWRPLARLRHLREHDHQLSLWAEGVEGFAADFRTAERALERAEQMAWTETGW